MIYMAIIFVIAVGCYYYYYNYFDYHGGRH